MSRASSPSSTFPRARKLPSTRSAPGSSKRFSWLAIALVATAALLRVALVPNFEFKDDVTGFYEPWVSALAAHGPGHIYDPGVTPAVDYPPGYLYVLWAIAGIRASLGASGAVAFRILLKIPDVIADFALAGVAFAIARRWLERERALAVAAIVLLAPVAWLDSAYWGQSDAIPATLLLTTALFALQRRFFWSWFALAIALLVKPQGIVIVPVLLIWHVYAGGGFASLVAAAAAGTTAAYLVTLPFTAARAPLAVLRFLFDRYTLGVAKIPYTSEGAFNFYTITRGVYESDASLAFGVPLHTWSLVLVAASLGAVALAFALMLRRQTGAGGGGNAERLLIYSIAISFAAFFIFGSRMHERYLMPSVAFGTLLVFDGLLPAVAVGLLSISFAVNCALILSGFTTGLHHPMTRLLAHAFSLLNLVVLATLAEIFRRRGFVRT